IRYIKPNELLREDSSNEPKRIDFMRWVAAILVLLGLLLVVSWQAGSIKIGLLFLAGLALTSGGVYLAASLFIRFVRHARSFSSFPLKQAISSLHRPGNQTCVIVMVVGLGVFLVISIQALQSNLVREFDIGRRASIANMFLIDIQRDQRDGVAQLIEE